ncbi:MAG: hypothetical protein WCN97_07985 [Thermoleophilia bacterium]|jgi:hypothetical protein|nr:hypothetical protein [Actinomycetota bacterium]
MTEMDDAAAMYRAAVDVALTGEVGMAPDFDRHLQEEVWRLLCNDRDRLLTYCQRMGIIVTKLTTRQTLKSDKPIFELIVTGDDADTVRKLAGRDRPIR